MATVHFMLQGKGGAGKSFISAMLYQYYMLLGVPVSAFDTDPVNATLCGYKDLPDVVPINIVEGNEVDAGRFDAMLESIVEMPPNHHVIVDNGASSFLAICGYVVTNKGFDLIKDTEHNLLIHCIITGSSAMNETLSGLESIIKNYKLPVIVWLNDYNGPIEVDGRKFEDFKIFKVCSNYIDAVIELPHYDTLTRRDMEKLLVKKIGFESFIKSDANLMARQRIRKIWQEFINVIQKTGVL